MTPPSNNNLLGGIEDRDTRPPAARLPLGVYRPTIPLKLSPGFSQCNVVVGNPAMVLSLCRLTELLLNCRQSNALRLKACLLGSVGSHNDKSSSTALMEQAASSDRKGSHEKVLEVNAGKSMSGGAEGGEAEENTNLCTPSRSYRMDYRLEEEVTRSCRDKHGRWSNPWPTWTFPSYSTLLRFMLLDKNHSNIPTSAEVLDSELPVMVPYFAQGPDRSEKNSAPGLRVTWLGHACVLVELDGLNILTDPIFSQRASPLQFLGPKRYRGPPCTVQQLPRIDAVMISHSHYDHLDAGTVASLNSRFGGDLRWFVPMGLMDWLSKAGCENVMELDWWEENCVPGRDDITFVCTPAQHWSKRNALDDNKSLWGSWSVLGPVHRFFFAGDTGYCSSFLEIGRRFGPFNLAAIPIGAYLPRDVMRGQHVDPEEAVQIHIDVQAKHSVAIHWGTFALAYEPYLDPPLRLKEALEKKNLPPDIFFTLTHGETRVLTSPQKDAFH